MTRGYLDNRAPSGWYSDADPAQQRWWDGRNWTAVTRPHPGPPDLRGRRLHYAGLALVIVGAIMVSIQFPWVYGDPDAEHPKKPPPTWVSAVGLTGLAFIALAIVALVACRVVRRRPRA